MKTKEKTTIAAYDDKDYEKNNAFVSFDSKEEQSLELVEMDKRRDLPLVQISRQGILEFSYFVDQSVIVAYAHVFPGRSSPRTLCLKRLVPMPARLLPPTPIS
jgi:hypothetical protein